MSNPFDSLRKQRLSEAEQQRQKEEAERRADDERKQKYLEIQAKHANLAEQHSEIVMRVLKFLQESMYPRSEVISDGIGKWMIGYNYTYSYSEWGQQFSDDYWHTNVKVTLSGMDTKEGYFECETEDYQANNGSRNKKCRLIENELVATLKQLHEKPCKSR